MVVDTSDFRKALKKSLPYYAIAAAGVLFFLLFRYVPMFGIIIAFKDVSPFSSVQDILTKPFVGIKWFQRFFESYYFWEILRNTILIRVMLIMFGFPIPILLALSLNEVLQRGFKRTIQTIAYIPHFFSTVVVAGLVMMFLSVDGGILNSAIVLLGGQPHLFLGDPRYFRWILVVTHIWQHTGWESILYLAAISSIDPELYESAVIDGANRMQKIRFITLPSISFIIGLLLIFAVGRLLDAGFELILLLYSEPVYEVADIIDTYVYRSGLLAMQYSFATAVGVFKSVAAMVLLLLCNFVAKRLGHSGLF